MISEPERLGPRARDLIENPEHELLLSAASGWEIALKARIGKLRLAQPADVLVPLHMSRNSIHELPVTMSFSLATTRLPDHHRDPFDRLLVVQAAAEALTLLTPDPAFRPYGVRIDW